MRYTSVVIDTTIFPCPLTTDSCSLLPHADAERFHLAVEVAAFQAEQLGGTAHVVAGFIDSFEDELAFVGVAGLLEGGESSVERVPALWVNGGRCLRSMCRARGLRIRTRSITFFEFAHVARPVVLGHALEGRSSAISMRGRPYWRPNSARNSRVSGGMSCLRSRSRRHKERDDVKPVEEVFAEVALGDLLFKVLVGGRR